MFTVSGRVAKRPADIGDVVKKGALLAVLDARPLRNNLAGAIARRETLRSQRTQLERDTARAERLLAAKAIGTEELEKTRSGRDTLASQLAAANADVNEARRLLGEASLRAPFSGTVIGVLLEPGEFAQAGKPAVLLSGERETEVEIEVPDSLRGSLRVGDEASVHYPLSDANDESARITNVGRASAGAGRLVPVVVALPKGTQAVAGQTAELVLSSQRPAALSIPTAAVVDPSGSRPSVFRVTDGVASIVEIELGELIDDRVVVTKGLSAGDQVVVAGHANLVSGEAVTIEEARRTGAQNE